MRKSQIVIIHCNNGNVINGDITGNNNATIVCNRTEFEKEFSAILPKLTFRGKMELMLLIYKFVDEYGLTEPERMENSGKERDCQCML